MDPSAPGWYPDPTGRHERRYWSGIRWSRHVDDGGVRGEDPIDGTGPVPSVPLDEAWSGGTPSRSTARVPAVPPSRSRRPVHVAVAAFAVVGLFGAGYLLLGGGGDAADSDDDGDAVLQAMAGVVHEKSRDSITDEEATCMAQAFVDEVGADRLVELGVLDGTDPELGPDEMSASLAGAFDCLDDETMVGFMEATWTSDAATGLDPGLAPCVFQGWFDVLGRDKLTDVYASFARVDPPPLTDILYPADFEAAMAVLSRCQEPSGGEAAAG
ncbi:MAG TPA: DUF2510 domain-containing protein [Acidimicrobiales bacterium]